MILCISLFDFGEGDLPLSDPFVQTSNILLSCRVMNVSAELPSWWSKLWMSFYIDLLTCKIVLSLSSSLFFSALLSSRTSQSEPRRSLSEIWSVWIWHYPAWPWLFVKRQCSASDLNRPGLDQVAHDWVLNFELLHHQWPVEWLYELFEVHDLDALGYPGYFLLCLHLNSDSFKNS